MQNKTRLGLGMAVFLISIFLVLGVVDSLNIVGPIDNIWDNATNNTLLFQFNYTDATQSTTSCELSMSIGGGPTTSVDLNSSVANNTLTTLRANTTLPNGTHTWNINCDGTQSTTRTVGIDTVAPITSHDAPATWQNSDVTVTFTSSDDGLSPTTIHSCQGQFCTPTATPSQVVSTEGNITVRYYTNDTAGNREPVLETYVLLDKSDPAIALSAPATGSTYLDQNTINFTFTPTDGASPTLNCSLVVDSVFNETNETTIDTASSTLTTRMADGTQNWYISCSDLAGNINTSVTRSITINVAPLLPTVASFNNLTNTTSINLYGYVNKTSSNVSAYVNQGANQNVYSYTATETSNATGTAIVNQTQSTGDDYFFVNEGPGASLPEGFTVGSYVEFSNHDRPFLERYEINSTTYFGGSQTWRINISPALNGSTNPGELVKVYNQSRPTGWFNISTTLFEGYNNVTISGERLQSFGPSTSVYVIGSDTEGPSFGFTITGNNTATNTPTIQYTIADTYGVNTSTLTAQFYNKNTSARTNLTSNDINCSGPLTNLVCSFTTTLVDGNYSLNVSATDVLGVSANATLATFVVEAVVLAVTEVNDPGVTTSTNQLYINWTDLSGNLFFSHYQVSAGTEVYPAAGYDNLRIWWNTTNNYVNDTWNITHGNSYYFHVRMVDTFETLGNVTSSDGIIYEDNTVPGLGNITIVGGSTNNAWTNDASQLSATWNFTDNETGINYYEYAVGTEVYPVTGWNTVKDVAATNSSSVTAAGLSLTDNASYYFSARARNNYQYGGGWSDWHTSSSSIKVDTKDPTGGLISYTFGEYTASSITLTYGTGSDNYSGINRAALTAATATMDPVTGACGGYSSHSEITNVTPLQPGSTTTYVYSGLQNGNCYKFGLYVYDEAGNREEYYLGNQIYNVSVDTTPPSTFTITDDGVVTSSTDLDFSWTAASDSESGIDYYEYRLIDSSNTEIVGWTNNSLTTSVLLQDQNLTDQEIYYLEVRAWNNIGLQTNVSSNGITYLDVSAPDALTVTSVATDRDGTNGYYDGNSANTTLVNLTGEPGLSCVWSYFDIAFTQPSQATNYSWWCDNTANSTGKYQCNMTDITEDNWEVHVTCRDEAGNKQTHLQNTDLNFTKESGPPVITINSPEDNSLLTGIATFDVSITDVSSYTAYYELKEHDTGSLVSNVSTSSGNFSINTASLGGEYNLTVHATDNYSNSASASINFIVDNNAPTAQVVSPVYYNQDFNVTIRAALFSTLYYNVTNSTGTLIQEGTWTYGVEQNLTLLEAQINGSSLPEGAYTVTAVATDDDSNTRTDTGLVYVDFTAPSVIGDIEIEPSGYVYENATITIYLNWKEANSMDEVIVEHDATGTNVNHTASATTPGDIIYENSTRYKIEIPAYMTTTNETITYTFRATDTAGNSANDSTRTLQVVNRPANITTTNLTDAWTDVVYNELVTFSDPDSSQDNDTFFNCSVASSASGLNVSIQSSSVCLLSWGTPTTGNHSVNITVNDFLNGALMNSTTQNFTLEVLPTAQHNLTLNSSHTMTINYIVNGSTIKTGSGLDSINTTVPTSNEYTIQLDVHNLQVTMTNFSATDDLDVFFQRLNNDSIDDNNSDLGPTRTDKPKEAYALRITTAYTGNFTIAFVYEPYGYSDGSDLRIYKFGYDEDSGAVNYSQNETLTTTDTNTTVYIVVSNFSTFVLASDVAGTGGGGGGGGSQNQSQGGGGGSSGGSSGGGGGSSSSSSSGGGGGLFVSVETCSDNKKNQDETGVDCGGPCDPCETCSDAIQNQGEEGVDCGGPCGPCFVPSCSDGLLNGQEEGVDCGGSCLPCPGCDNNYLDDGEEGVDCGGVCPEECGPAVIQTTATVEKPVGLKSGYVWILMITIALFGAIAAIWIYNREEQAVQDVVAVEKVEELEVAELAQEERDLMARHTHNYLSQGMTEEQIKQQLLQDGFKQHHINQVLTGVIRDMKLQELQGYFDEHMQNGYTEEELKEWVLNHGVDQGLLDEAMARRYGKK